MTRTRLLLIFGLWALPAVACKCAGSASACSEFWSSDVVFIGTVESAEPKLFDLWDPAVRQRVFQRFSAEQIEDLFQDDDSQKSFDELKQLYSLYLEEPYKSKLALAKTREEFEELVTAIEEQGKRVRFQVKEVLRGDKQDTIDVRTGFGGGDCGYPFQKGETYLVYAGHDVKNQPTTSICSGTKRLSDAGEDLAYLYFVQHSQATSSRLYGFVTSSELDQQTPRFHDSVTHPVVDVVLEVKSAETVRYAEPNREGKFFVDGLKPGYYDVSVFASGFPEEVHLLEGPRRVELKAGGCSTEVILVRSKAPPVR